MEKKLQRSRNRKVIAGIGGGLGEYLDIDPIIIRIILVLITIFHGIGILVYIVMWIVIPEEPYGKTTAEYAEKPIEDQLNDVGETIKEEAKKVSEEVNKKAASPGGRILVGVILILIGLVFLSERFFPFFDFEFVFAIGIIILGVALLFNFFNKSEKSS